VPVLNNDGLFGLPGGSFQNTGTLAVSVAQNIESFTHTLSGITIIFIPDKEPKCRTARLNTGHPMACYRLKQKSLL